MTTTEMGPAIGYGPTKTDTEAAEERDQHAGLAPRRRITVRAMTNVTVSLPGFGKSAVGWSKITYYRVFDFRFEQARERGGCAFSKSPSHADHRGAAHPAHDSGPVARPSSACQFPGRILQEAGIRLASKPGPGVRRSQTYTLAATDLILPSVTPPVTPRSSPSSPSRPSLNERAARCATPLRALRVDLTRGTMVVVAVAGGCVWP